MTVWVIIVALINIKNVTIKKANYFYVAVIAGKIYQDFRFIFEM